MKKLPFLFIAFFSLCITSCKLKVDSYQVVVESGPVAHDSLAALEIADTLKTHVITCTQKVGYWDYSSEVVYPIEGSNPLVNSIRNWISESLCISNEAEEKVAPYSGDMTDGKAMLGYYAQSFMKSINADDYADLPSEIRCEMDIKIVKEFETDSIISFTIQKYWFGGGAHGSTIVSGSTFRKSDGKQMGWDMVASKKALMPEIVAQLEKHFEVKTEEELMGNLMLADLLVPDQPSVVDIPFPQTIPWISADGLVMIYQQYEIAAYACGMPTVVIPFSRLKHFLSEEYKPLF